MTKILSVEKIREADKFTIKNEPIASVDLMERAGNKCADWLLNRLPDKISVRIIVGQGNNGGDGLVIARHLLQNSFEVVVDIVKFTDKYSIDFSTNLKRLEEIPESKINVLEKIEDLKPIAENEIIIESIFGSGLSKPIEKGFIADVINVINSSDTLVISVDIPSGLFADKTVDATKYAVVKADITLSLQFPKMAFFFAENAQFVGQVEIIPIGLHPDFINSVKPDAIFLDPAIAIGMRRPRAKFSHKGNYGHALLIAGSFGKFGAAVLASKACLKAGVGLLTTHIPKTANDILQISTPEAMLSLDENDLCFSKVPNLDSYNAIGIGPGLGVYKEAANAFKILIQETKVPILIDADGLNILAENKTWLSFLPENSILTPHPKEFERLVGKWDNSFEMIEKQKEFSSKHKVICVLKGAYTSVSYPGGELFFNSSGNPSMATAGSGDVLSGIILSLMAQNYHTGLAALYGVFIHGLSADLLMEKESMESLIASDIVDNLGKAFNYKIQLKGAK